MLSCYLIGKSSSYASSVICSDNRIEALLIAVAHALLFVHLDGKPADGPERIAPQTYISTASNVLSNAFGAFLKGALAVAFTQYLWRILRLSTLKVRTIETLFCIRSNPFLLFSTAAIQSTPLLFCLAALIWATQIVVGFPPGALTIESSNRTSVAIATVPTFNASFVSCVLYFWQYFIFVSILR
jgi:hypothetical protein